MVYATLFDINYLSRGLTLFASLKKHSNKPFRFFVLAIDNQVKDFCAQEGLSEITIVTLKDMAGLFPELENLEKERSRAAFVFTLSPYWPLYLLKTYPEIAGVTTLDADIFFLSDPEIIFSQYPDADILITPHAFSPVLKRFEGFGRYNVSFQYFRNSAQGLSCLEQWRKDCANWCDDAYNAALDQYADQKYLDKWPESYPGLRVIETAGSGIAPWNIETADLRLEGNRFYCGQHPLVYYHFHHLRIFGKYFAAHNLYKFSITRFSFALKKLYQTYILTLRKLGSSLHLDNAIARNAHMQEASLFRRLIFTRGYFFVSSWLIMHLDPYPFLSNTKQLFKRNARTD
jgi:hypothetical protein